MVSEVNKVQKLQFELMKRASFNAFDGKGVVEDLLRHKDLWESVVMTSEFYATATKKGDMVGGANLICLRDIIDNDWNVDTVFILVDEDAKGKQKDLELLVRKNWNADEIDWIDGEDASGMLGSRPPEKRILRVWWD